MRPCPLRYASDDQTHTFVQGERWREMCCPSQLIHSFALCVCAHGCVWRRVCAATNCLWQLPFTCALWRVGGGRGGVLHRFTRARCSTPPPPAPTICCAAHVAAQTPTAPLGIARAPQHASCTMPLHVIWPACPLPNHCRCRLYRSASHGWTTGVLAACSQPGPVPDSWPLLGAALCARIAPQSWVFHGGAPGFLKHTGFCLICTLG